MHLDRKSLSEILCTTKLAQSTSQYFFCTTKLAHSTYYKACTKHFPALLCTTKACTKHFPVLLCTTKLAQSISQYYFVLQSLHKALPSTTLYYKACTKHVPVLLCTTKLAQRTSQYYFVLLSLLLLVLQSLHKALPSTTLYYKACTKHFPVLLCTTKPPQVCPSTTLYCKSCTKHFPVLLCYADGNTRWTTIMQPFHSDLQAQIRDTHRTTHTGTTLVAEHRGGTHSRMKRPSRPPAHTRYLSSPAEATLHGKTQGFVLRLPPQHKPHATSCNHYNAFCSITSQTCTYLRTWQHQMTTIMQPFHSDLQAQIQDTHRATHT